MVSSKANCGGYDAAGTLSYADALLIPMAQLPAGTLLLNGNFCGQPRPVSTGSDHGSGSVGKGKASQESVFQTVVA